ncbi:MAG: response regulator [Pseudomonadota bacterium]
MKTRPLRVLVLDDEIDNIRILEVVLGERWKIRGITDVDDLYQGRVRLEDYDVLFLDLVLVASKDWQVTPTGPDPKLGYQVLQWVTHKIKGYPVVVLSAALNEERLKMFQEAAAKNVLCVPKPADLHAPEFQEMVERFVASVPRN